MKLTQLIEEQKKEARKNLGATVLATGGTRLDIEITTAITKGYELALEEVEKLAVWESYDDEEKQMVPMIKLSDIAHLKQNVLE